ncbi:MAG: hypothetical protein MR902_08990 [Campylobacter sp.]|nr:hypothetical protein [Campylobacter sp.]
MIKNILITLVIIIQLNATTNHNFQSQTKQVDILNRALIDDNFTRVKFILDKEPNLLNLDHSQGKDL